MPERTSPYLYAGLFAALFVTWLASDSLLIQPLLLLATGLLAWLGGRRLRGSQPKDTWWLLIAGSSALLTITLIWNTCFYLYVNLTGFEEDIFRSFLQTRHAPVYGHRALPRSLAALLAPLVVALFFARATKLGARAEPGSHGVELGLWGIALALAFGASDGALRLLEQIGHYYVFALDIGRFSGVADLLARYVAQMHEMSVHNGHYPPGNLLLLAISSWQGVPELGRLVVVLASGATVLVIGGIARLLDLAPRERLVAQLLFVASPAVLILPSIALTPLYMFVAAVCVWALLDALLRGRMRSAVALGLAMALASFLSFSVAFTGLLIALFTALGLWLGWLAPGRVVRVAAVSLACFLGALLALGASTGFDILTCFEQAFAHNHALMGGGHDTVVRWLIRSTGNLLDYLLLLGPPQALLCALALPALWRKRGTPTAGLGLATLLTLVFAGFSGLHFLETARIWIHLTPLLVLVAGREFVSAERDLRGAPLPAFLLFSLCGALIFEFLITTVPWAEQTGIFP